MALAHWPADLGVILQTPWRGGARSAAEGAFFEDEARRLSQTLHEPLVVFQPPGQASRVGFLGRPPWSFA